MWPPWTPRLSKIYWGVGLFLGLGAVASVIALCL